MKNRGEILKQNGLAMTSYKEEEYEGIFWDFPFPEKPQTRWDRFITWVGQAFGG